MAFPFHIQKYLQWIELDINLNVCSTSFFYEPDLPSLANMSKMPAADNNFEHYVHPQISETSVGLLKW